MFFTFNCRFLLLYKANLALTCLCKQKMTALKVWDRDRDLKSKCLSCQQIYHSNFVSDIYLIKII